MALLGRPAEELLQQPLAALSEGLAAGGAGSSAVSPAETLLAAGPVRDHPCHLLGKDGARIPVKLSASPLRDQEGKTCGMVALVRGG